MADVKKDVEAILFAAGRVVTVKEFQALLKLKDEGLIKESVRELMEEYEARDSPTMIVEENDGWKLTVRERFLPVVHSINPHTELSKTILETLAVIAWKQPMLQSAVIKIRTNKAYDHITELERLGFITRERYGRSFLIKVTQKFLDYFDLPEPKAMKDLFKDFKDIETKMKKAGKSKQDVRVGAGAADLNSQDSPAPGAEFETYIDALPPMETPVTETRLETYEEPVEDVSVQTPEDAELEEDKLDEAQRAFEKEDSDEESEAEKARRLAKEVLGESEEENDAEETVQERMLHPELEEFIESEHKAMKSALPRKSTDDKGSGDSADDGSDDESRSAKDADDEGDDSSSDDAPDGEDRDVVAEEYPGQFAKEDADSRDDDKEKREEDA